MKNFIKLFLLSIIALCVIGCANPANNSNGDDENKPVDTTELKIALYNKILGTWELADGEDNDSYQTLVFASDSITLDGKKYSFDISTDFLLEAEVDEEKRMDSIAYINVDGLTFIDFDTSLNNVSNIVIGKVYYEDLGGFYNAFPDDFVRVSGGNSESGSGENLDFSVVGDWSYTIAAGNTKTTFSIEDDGTFSFTKNSDVTNGTYSLSGNKITFEFDQNASMNIKDTFVVSGSDTEITLTLEKSVSTYNGQENVSTSMSSLLQIFYNIITSTSVTLSK